MEPEHGGFRRTIFIHGRSQKAYDLLVGPSLALHVVPMAPVGQPLRILRLARQAQGGCNGSQLLSFYDVCSRWDYSADTIGRGTTWFHRFFRLNIQIGPSAPDNNNAGRLDPAGVRFRQSVVGRRRGPD